MKSLTLATIEIGYGNKLTIERTVGGWWAAIADEHPDDARRTLMVGEPAQCWDVISGYARALANGRTYRASRSAVTYR